jgi:hypothetical protein
MNDQTDSPQALPLPAASAFHTRSVAREGRKLHLYTPDGTRTAHYIIVRGVDSDEFIFARNKANRRAGEIAAIEDDKQRAEALGEETRRMRWAFVAGWSFDDPEITPKDSPNWLPCTEANVMNFFREAPQIAEMVDRFASQRANFFGKPLGS